MPDYDFRALSPVDFELLARDLLNAELSLALQSYAPGRDQGIDLRYVADSGAVTVGQCKHYLDSSWSTFMRAVRGEGERGKDLRADRYLFITSRALTPRQQDEVVAALASLHAPHGDIWDRAALNAALLRHPEVERRHVKLWLTSAGVLDTLLNAGQWQRGEATLDDVRDQARMWVHTQAFDDVLDTLAREGVCIVYGPPGVGKTFLAEMVLLSTVTAVSPGWEVVHVSGNIEDAWRALRRDSTNQIFYYNDFLGEGELTFASKNEPSELPRFIARVQRLREHKRFIMTTREERLREAAARHDPLRDLAGDAELYGVRLDRYPARVRAEILFNHLYFSDLPQSDRDRIAFDNRIVSIVEHPAYNPRLILTGLKTVPHGSADQKLEAIMRALDHPEDLWKSSFRNLSPLAQQVLLTMATLPARLWPLPVIRELTGGSGLDWRPALRLLDGTWLAVTGQSSAQYVTLANPSCRDYLLTALDDEAVADGQVERVRLLDQILSLTRSAGLLTDAVSSVSRPELANALTSRRDWMAGQIRERTDAGLEGTPPLTAMRMLADAAELFVVYGSEPETKWLMERIAQWVDSEEAAAIRPAGAFRLAELLAALSAPDPGQHADLCPRLIMIAVDNIKAVRDLDAYEALPAELRFPEARDRARERARAVLADEMGRLLMIVDDPDVIRWGADELERQSQWYGLEVNIGPLLDRANDLQAGGLQSSPWPETDRPGEEDPGDDETSIRQVFSRLRQ